MLAAVAAIHYTVAPYYLVADNKPHHNLCHLSSILVVPRMARAVALTLIHSFEAPGVAGDSLCAGRTGRIYGAAFLTLAVLVLSPNHAASLDEEFLRREGAYHDVSIHTRGRRRIADSRARKRPISFLYSSPSGQRPAIAG